MNTVLKQKKTDRFLFLKNVYESCSGSVRAIVNMFDVGKELGFDSSYTSDIVNYLSGEGLIQPAALGGGIRLTHSGVKEYEQALEDPQNPTQHFLPLNIINIGTMNNSSLQQGTNESIINQNLDKKNIDDLDSLIQAVEKLQQTISLTADLKQEWLSELETLKIQQKSPKPKSVIIQESLKTIRNLAEGIAGNALAPSVINQITHFLNHF